MDDGGPTASIIVFVVLLIVDVFFYGFSAALLALNESEVNKKAEDGDKRSVCLAAFMKNPSKYINTLQFVVTLLNIVMGYFSVRIIQGQIQNLILTIAVSLYIILVFGVLLPKKIATRFPEKWAYGCVRFMYGIVVMLTPVTALISISVKGILRLIGLKPETIGTEVTEEEIMSMVNEGHEKGVIEASEAKMITNIFEYGDKEAQDIMTNRSNIVGIDGEMTLADAIAFMLEEKNSRYPVFEENIDHIIGILHLKDALRMESKEQNGQIPVKDIDGLLREAKFIPQTRNIDDLFKTMQSLKVQMVIVIDEYGQTVGLVAMEDILEEIVGNILDEYDEEDEFIEEKGNNEYIIEGKTPLDELEERFGISFDEEEYETLNGFLISKMDRIPEDNEDFDIDVSGYNFKVLSVENKMIHSVLVKPIEVSLEESEQ